MTDSKLIELAAKAVGYTWEENPFPEDGREGAWYDSNGCKSTFRPLADDGDALRLACDLGLNVYPIARTASGAACSAAGSASEGRLSEVSDPSQDTRAATRRAIVLAAAEIGKAVQKPLAP